MPQRSIIPVDAIARRIAFIRGQRVMMDADLAELYEVTTSHFNRAVKRNQERFPKDFMFQLTLEEYASLRFQSVISKPGSGGRRYLPYVHRARRTDGRQCSQFQTRSRSECVRRQSLRSAPRSFGDT